MYKLITIMAIVVIAYLTLGRSTTLDSQVLNLQNQDTYAESSSTVGGRCYEEKCLTIYVAPWCPACRSLKPTIVALTEELQAEGMDVKLVVGNDSQEDTIKYAKKYPFPVYLDADASFYKKAKQRGVPFFLVTDKKGKITEKLAGGMANVRAMHDKLKI